MSAPPLPSFVSLCVGMKISTGLFHAATFLLSGNSIYDYCQRNTKVQRKEDELQEGDE